MSQVRLTPDERRKIIVTAIKRIASEEGAITHGDVAKRCTVLTSKATVKHYFPTRADMLEAAKDA